MKQSIVRFTFAAIAIILAFAAISLPWLTAQEKEMPSKYITWNSDGDLEKPKNWREWIFVGTPVTPNDMNNGKAAFPEFHNVYIDPDSYGAYKETGKFPDGTVLIKELVSVGGKAATSGLGYFQGEFIGLEAAVKSKSHHPDEPGYWAYYSFTAEHGEPLKPSSPKFASAQCNACHQASAQDDWVFTQYYPVLRAAKPTK